MFPCPTPSVFIGLSPPQTGLLAKNVGRTWRSLVQIELDVHVHDRLVRILIDSESNILIEDGLLRCCSLFGCCQMNLQISRPDLLITLSAPIALSRVRGPYRSMKESLTVADVNEIFYAFDCDESGSEHYQLRQKLYRMFPVVKEMHVERERQMQELSKRQTDNRKTITTDVLDSLDRSKDLLPQLAEWMSVKKFVAIRSYNSDEICLAGDIFRYAGSDIKDRIAAELKVPSDSNTWHTLVRFLESAQYKARISQK